jgi:curved DNA-binding protein CbpA
MRRSAYEVLQVRDDAEQVVIVAAFRALAGVYHPDRNPSPAAERRMAELNEAFAAVRTEHRRAAYDRTGLVPRTPPSTVVPPPPRATASNSSSHASDVLDFGRYAGWSLRDLVRHDPAYLRWLGRHSSGIRYRQRIEALLSAAPDRTASERIFGR